ncbi:hypothetical protein GCK72_013455 [Caenorhabditis remanei]|uniref:Uncharacterized protein n=1 Tax=Caenorhabditis remanei TaxID=31234 RepID=A0A6A5GNT7_CAERE|nr:hypothetical protein GCK72_013455 [Caenorhabditis remanei]KAF1757000.1 hypothetical protein GCK72_013455 [Caenorhabditis remanei]
MKNHFQLTVTNLLRNWDTVLVVLGVVHLDVRNLLLRIAHRCRCRLLEAAFEDKNELCRVEQSARRLWPRLLIGLITMDTRSKQRSLGRNETEKACDSSVMWLSE